MSPAMWRTLFVLAIGVSSVAGFSTGRISAASAAPTPSVALDDRAFPHARHARLFPNCAGCHAGIAGRDSAAMFPAAATCTACHNGQDVAQVSWTSRRRPATNLRFDHATHVRMTDSASTRLDCTRCHGDGPMASRMQVTRPRPETCLACHPHEAPSHFAQNSPCATCHVPLTRAVALSDSAVRGLPKPPSHEAADFIGTHGAVATQSIASCATCHARESCARCHVDAASSRVIRALGSDVRIARLERGALVYPVPATHRRSDFPTTHGVQARAGTATCGTCHAQPSCRTCHTGSLGARVIDALPRGDRGAPGVRLHAPRPSIPPAWPPLAVASRTTAAPVLLRAVVDTPPVAAPTRVVRVHADDFVRTHGPAAATKRLDCAGCHQQRFCSTCHQGAGERRYHPLDFVARHAPEAYARETKCTSCHNTQVFCQSCHRNVVGIGANSRGRSGPAHSGQPLWLLQHGEAARRGMESCATCHQQTDCMQCHSGTAGRINPHGRNFDAAAMQKRNPTLCSYCHLRPPS